MRNRRWHGCESARIIIQVVPSLTVRVRHAANSKCRTNARISSSSRISDHSSHSWVRLLLIPQAMRVSIPRLLPSYQTLPALPMAFRPSFLRASHSGRHHPTPINSTPPAPRSRWPPSAQQLVRADSPSPPAPMASTAMLLNHMLLVLLRLGLGQLVELPLLLLSRALAIHRDRPRPAFLRLPTTRKRNNNAQLSSYALLRILCSV